MLKNSASSRRRAVTVAALLGVGSSPPSLWAQEILLPSAPPAAAVRPLSNLHGTFEQRLRHLNPEAKEATAAPELYQIAFPIRNVKSSLIAYWLDPAHPIPADLRVSMALGGDASVAIVPAFAPVNNDNPFLHPSVNVDNPSANLPRFPGNGNGPADLKLPEGVTSLEAYDQMNSLMATGTKEGLKALDALIPTLDVPLVQFEIEAQFLQIPRADLPIFGFQRDKLPKDSPDQFGAVTVPLTNLRVHELVRDKSAKILTAPRVTVIDGLMGQLQQVTLTPFSLDLGDPVESIRFHPTVQEKPKTDNNQSVAYVTTTIGLKATANQAKDDLITVSVTPTLITRTLSVVATVRDGQPFVIQMSPPQDDKQIVVIITPRRIRRVGDDT